MVLPWVAIWEHHNLAYFFVVVDILGSAVAEMPRGFVLLQVLMKESFFLFELNLPQNWNKAAEQML